MGVPQHFRGQPCNVGLAGGHRLLSPLVCPGCILDASCFTPQAHIEGAGSLTANGDHDVDVYSAYLGGGYRIDREAWSWGSEAALRAATMFEIAHGLVISELWGGRRYDFGIDGRVITAHFAGAPKVAFSTDGQDVEHWAFVTGGGDTVKGHRNGGIRLKGDDVSRVKRVLSIRC